jgi:CRP-like cAMP-binding protein
MSLAKKIQNISTLSPEALAWLEKHIQTVDHKKGDIILDSGKVCNHLYYVASGMIGGSYVVDGNEICNWIAAENDFGTSWYSFISRQASYESIECYETCTLSVISYEHIQTFYKTFPETERIGRLLLEEYYSRLEERLLAIQFRSAKERYDFLFQSRPEIIRRAPLGRIATYLGMKQETLSRIRSTK